MPIGICAVPAKFSSSIRPLQAAVISLGGQTPSHDWGGGQALTLLLSGSGPLLSGLAALLLACAIPAIAGVACSDDGG